MSTLLSMVAVLPSTEEEPDLGLIWASVVKMGGQGYSEDKTQKARAALLRTTGEHFLLCTAGDIQHVGAFTVLLSITGAALPFTRK